MKQKGEHLRGKLFLPRDCALERLGGLAGLNTVDTVCKVLVRLMQCPRSWPGQTLSRVTAEPSPGLQWGQHNGALVQIILC